MEITQEIVGNFETKLAKIDKRHVMYISLDATNDGIPSLIVLNEKLKEIDVYDISFY